MRPIDLEQSARLGAQQGGNVVALTPEIDADPKEGEWFAIEPFLLLLRKRYVWPRAAAMVAAVITVAALLGTFVPLSRTSVITFVSGLFGHGDLKNPQPSQGLSGALFNVFAVLVIFVMLVVPRIGRGSALEEEYKYRLGAEKWTTRQRVSKCIRFGLAHIWNLVVPLCAVVAIGMAGSFFMWVYLSSYRKLGNDHAAANVAARVHFTYNRMISIIIGLVLLTVLVTAFIPS